MTIDRRAITARFEGLASPDTSDEFFGHVAADVDWTVIGHHPLAGRYTSKQAFIDATFARLNRVLTGGVKLIVEAVHVDGQVVIAELRSISTAIDGIPFDNLYCWVCELDDAGEIVVVRAYLDSALVRDLIERCEPLMR